METTAQVKRMPRLEEARRILESPNRAYELLNLIGVRDELLEACKAAFRALPGSADAIAIQCQFAIAKAEGR